MTSRLELVNCQSYNKQRNRLFQSFHSLNVNVLVLTSGSPNYDIEANKSIISSVLRFIKVCKGLTINTACMSFVFLRQLLGNTSQI